MASLSLRDYAISIALPSLYTVVITENVRVLIFFLVILLRWSLKYGHRWLQFHNNRCSNSPIFQISFSLFSD